MKIMVNKGEFKDLIQREWIIANGIGGLQHLQLQVPTQENIMGYWLQH